MIVEPEIWQSESEAQPTFVPIVKSGCICPNKHEAVDGMIRTSPACVIHGCITRAVPRKK